MVAEALAPDKSDTLLNVGSGLGQPDIDIAKEFDVHKIVGINNNQAQVNYANRLAAHHNLHNVVQHRFLDARRIGESAVDVAPTCIISIEALAEVPELHEVLDQCFALLPRGGRIAFCDVVRVDDQPLRQRVLGRPLRFTTSLLYGDHWRSANEYEQLLTTVGFRQIRCESIGARVYSPAWEYVRQRSADLNQQEFPRVAKWLAIWNFSSLAKLFALQQVDYVILSGAKP